MRRRAPPIQHARPPPAGTPRCRPRRRGAPAPPVRRTQSTSTGSAAAASTPGPPATISVSSAVSGRRQRTRHEPQPGRGRHALAAARHDPQRVRRLRLPRDEIVGRCEHLQRPGDVQQLHVREGEHFDRRGSFGGERGVFGISARAMPVLGCPSVQPGDEPMIPPTPICRSAPCCSRASTRSISPGRSRSCRASRTRPTASTARPPTRSAT